MNKKDYIEQFCFEDFIQNEYFITSVLQPNEKSEKFWKTFESKGHSNLEDYWLAKEFIVSLSHSPQIPQESEMTGLWNEISKSVCVKKRFLYRYIGIAASVAACIAIFFLLTHRQNEQDALFQEQIFLFVENAAITVPESNEIQLVLSDKHTVAIKKDGAEITYSQDGITIGDAKVNDANISHFNQLIVPYGKRSVITLSDSSKIWVNAGTRLVYPVVFADEKREIYVEGEVFLEVTASAHRPFTVRTAQANITVLGTQFNVSTHGNNDELTVALVSGAVGVSSPKNEYVLKPNEVYTYSKDGIETIDHKDDIYKYISWRDGLYIFQSERMEIIASRLSRYYGTQIKCHETAAGMKCTGKLDLTEELETVLKGLSIAVPVKYSYKDDMVVIEAR